MPTFADLATDNPNIRNQYDDWRSQRLQAGNEATDYQAFRQHLIASGAHDPGEREIDDFNTPAAHVTPTPAPATPTPAEFATPTPMAVAPPTPAAVAPLAAQQNITVNVANMAPPPQNTVILVDNNRGPGFAVRAIWFIFIGWWLAFFWIGAAWLLNLTVIGLPLGLTMINAVPKVMTLSPDRRNTTVVQSGNSTVITMGTVPQLPFLLRAVYFVLVGWWASLIWSLVAWGLCVLIVTLPAGLLMFHYLPLVTTLRRN